MEQIRRVDNGYPPQQRQRVRQPMEPEDDYDNEHPHDEPPADDGTMEGDSTVDDTVGAEDAVLDLAELEQLQEEAERMKGLGNKHMAAQEYTRAYNAYSAALQLSPVGPSSHVFLSNRAASLLSLKRYSAAAVDARRAVALAPTFGKAHARLGQALYFLKQYAGAVEAYEDALHFEEDGDGNNNGGGGGNSAVTRAYLQKAKEKLAKQEEKERRKRASGGISPMGGAGIIADDVTVGEESVNPTIAYSIATDKDRVGIASGLQTSNNERVNAVANAPLARTNSNPQLPLQGLSIKEDEANDNQNQHADMGSPFKSFHGPNTRASPSFMTVNTGPMGGPAQRRVDQSTTSNSTQPQDAGTRSAVEQVVASPPLKLPTPTFSPANNDFNTDINDEPDPDFDEALRLQRRATHFLSNKQYRIAVDEFSSALFLVPDDPILTPQLHVGRAHALNGQERFESGKNDALMALKHILRDRVADVSAAEAYSVLGKSLYYSKDYSGSIEALEECERIWKEHGGKLSVFDEAYLDQCQEALDAGLGTDHDDGMSLGGGKSVMSLHSVVSCVKEGRSMTNIPKLKPPRFVSREKALSAVPNLPPMPKDWPLQSPTSPSSIATGPERTVTFLSDAMGIKLNRGTDGLVRVLSVANLPPGSPIFRKGEIYAGDLVREAGGVDLRRPITATMWGDTVALIKMAPRPLSLILAKELANEFKESLPRTSAEI